MPVFEIKMPSGTYEITAPDENSAFNAANQYLPSNEVSPVEQSAPQGNPLPFMSEAPETETLSTQLGSAANEAIATVSGLPMDASRGIMNMMGADIPSDAWGGSEYIRNKLTDTGFIQPEAQSKGLQTARTAGRMATEAMLPLGAASKFANAVKSPILKEALTSVINNPMRTLGLEGLSGATGGIAGEITEEFTDNPILIGAAQLAGGLTPSTIGAGASGLTRKALGGGKGNLDDIAENVADFRSIGAEPTVAQATGSRAVGATEKVSAMIPFGGKRFQDNAQKTYAAIKNTLSKNIDDLGGTDATKQDVGGVVKKGLQGFSEKGGKKADELFDAVSKHIPAKTPITMTQTRELLEDMVGDIAGAENISRTLNDPALTRLLHAVKADMAGTNVLPYDALKPLRKKIWNKASSFSNESAGDYKRLYGAIAEDTANSADNLSEGASRAMSRANKYYSSYKNRMDTHLDKIMGKDDVEHIITAMENSGRKGSVQLNTIKKSLTPDEWNIYVSRQLDRLGKTAESPDFSTDKFISQYNKMSPAIKNILFANKPKMKRDLDAIFKVSENVKLDKAILSNPSGTADKGYASVMALGAYFQPVLAAKAGLGIAGNKMLSVALTSPKTLDWLAKGVKMRPEGLAGHITRLATIAQSGDENDRNAALEIINMLSPQQETE